MVSNPMTGTRVPRHWFIEINWFKNSQGHQKDFEQCVLDFLSLLTSTKMRSAAQSLGTNYELGHFYAQTQVSMHFGNTPTEQRHQPKFSFSFLNSLIFDFSEVSNILITESYYMLRGFKRNRHNFHKSFMNLTQCMNIFQSISINSS